MVLQSIARSIPGLATIIALHKSIARLHKTIASRRVEAIWRQPVHDQSMCVEWTVRFAILPMFASIQAAQQRPSFNRGEQTPCHQGIGGNPANVAGIGS